MYFLKIKVDHHFHYENSSGDNNHSNDLKEVLQKLDSLTQKLETMAKTLDEVLESVRSNATVGESAIALMTEIKTKLDEVLSGTVIPPAVQAKIDEIFEVSETDKTKLEEAILANTPTTSTPPVEE